MTDDVRAGTSSNVELEAFIERCLEAVGHQVGGNSEPFLATWSHADDVAILGAIGSYARGWGDVRTHLLAAARNLDWTSLSVQRLLTVASEDLAVTVVLEHMTREGEEPSSRTLRTTHAYRREPDGWRLFLRHANTVTEDDQERERAILGHESG